jgi:hypothetical protein
MMSHTLIFTPANPSSSKPRAITLNLHDPQRTERDWSCLVEVLGFEESRSLNVHGVDWPQAIELGASLLPAFLDELATLAGGGSFDPPLSAR